MALGFVTLLFNPSMSNVGLAHLATLHVQYLDLQGCSQLTDAGLPTWWPFLFSISTSVTVAESQMQDWLTCLLFPSCTLILVDAIDSGTLGLCRPLRSSTIISVTAAESQMQDWPTCLLFHSCTLILVIVIDDCCAITNTGLAHLSTLHLQHLDLSFCSRVTNAGLQRFKCHIRRQQLPIPSHQPGAWRPGLPLSNWQRRIGSSRDFTPAPLRCRKRQGMVPPAKKRITRGTKSRVDQPG
eukprot:g32937.t1